MNKLFLLIFGVITPLCIQDLEAGKTKVCKSEDAKEFVQRIPRERVSKTSIKEGFYQNHHSKVAGKNPKEISVSTNIPNEETAESIIKTEESKTTCVNTAKIDLQREKLIETLEKSITYLDSLIKIILPTAVTTYQNGNKIIAFELGDFIGGIEATEFSINNCICFLNLDDDEGLGSLSAEDMGDWVNTINAQLKEFNERNILKVNIEDHGTLIQTSARKLQTLWKVNTQK